MRSASSTVLSGNCHTTLLHYLPIIMLTSNMKEHFNSLASNCEDAAHHLVSVKVRILVFSMTINYDQHRFRVLAFSLKLRFMLILFDVHCLALSMYFYDCNIGLVHFLNNIIIFWILPSITTTKNYKYRDKCASLLKRLQQWLNFQCESWKKVDRTTVWIVCLCK